ncbi:MAG: DNA-directed RNA polymerase subunit omega [Pseudanabaenaceae cyanobacterium SKYGB_i_bin29]|nr:DNA-directed RNA polymerase subunit omega [Pseudanabaenaceae cyanobacterium SKYG29]MDW8422067.1 DNA-directed RNA polymerase subunit omega [Pseudanabaenaceae cyanobacterium SKYGB_i_bin29]
MAKRSSVDSLLVNRRMEELINSAANRYRITLQVASRAKSRYYRDQEDQDRSVKPIVQAILELAEEQSQPQILSD